MMIYKPLNLVGCAAHHEAGHLVVAAVLGLNIRPEGLMIDPKGFGLACYNKEPGNSDLSREKVILASLSGFKAEEQFRASARTLHGASKPPSTAATGLKHGKSNPHCRQITLKRQHSDGSREA